MRMGRGVTLPPTACGQHCPPRPCPSEQGLWPWPHRRVTLRDGHHRSCPFLIRVYPQQLLFRHKTVPAPREGSVGRTERPGGHEDRSPHAGQLEGAADAQSSGNSPEVPEQQRLHTDAHTGVHGGPVHLEKMWQQLKCPKPTRVHPTGHIQLCPSCAAGRLFPECGG